MNYLKIYTDIIENAMSESRERNANTKYESHHIIPKCIGGNNKKENLVLLTYREHFICHKLLTFIYSDNDKIRRSFYMMSTSKKKKELYRVSSREYAEAKKQLNLYLRSDEVREKRKETIFKRNFSEEKIQKFLETLKDCKYSPSEESTIRISKNTFDTNKQALQNKIEQMNETGCYIKLDKNT